MTKATAVKFSWNDDNTDVVVNAYTAKLEENKDEANSPEFLRSLAKQVGAASEVSVRTKLVNVGAYVKGEVRKVGGGSSIRKAHYIRALENYAKESDIAVESGDLDSLEHCRMDTLKTLAKLVPGIEDAVVKMTE